MWTYNFVLRNMKFGKMFEIDANVIGRKCTVLTIDHSTYTGSKVVNADVALPAEGTNSFI